MRIDTALPFSTVLQVLIVFSIDPYTSLVADNVQKLNYRDTALSDDRLNKDKNNNRNDDQVTSDVQDLELAQGIKDSLKEAGFNTVNSILKEAPLDISSKLGIDPYVAQIIKDAAKRSIDGSSKKETI
jgi:hypothetical protein